MVSINAPSRPARNMNAGRPRSRGLLIINPCGFGGKTTGPASRLNNPAVLPSQPAMPRAARASPLPLRSGRGRSGYPRNQEQQRQSAPQDRIFGLGRAADALGDLYDADALRLPVGRGA